MEEKKDQQWRRPQARTRMRKMEEELRELYFLHLRIPGPD
jgi:hypothetical protein